MYSILATHHAVDAILVSGKFGELYGVVRVGDVPDANVRHVTALTGRQKSSIAGEGQRGDRFPASV